MVGFGGELTDGEIWALIQYIRNFSGEHGPGMMGSGGGMEHSGSRGGWTTRGIVKVRGCCAAISMSNLG
jgi:hypothetical protein